MVNNDMNAKPASPSTVQCYSLHCEGMENMIHLVKASYLVKKREKIHSCNLPVRRVVSLIAKDTSTM